MKKKLHVSFWALGILVLLLSQLIALVPVSRVSAAPLTLDAVQTSTYKFSVYSAMHSCLNQVSTGKTYSGPEDFDGAYTHFIGFAGPDEGNNDGLVYCGQASTIWMNIAGIANVTDMMTQLGFTKGAQRCSTSGINQQSCSDTWELKGTSKNDVLSKHSKLAQGKGIPTSTPTWGRYMLAVSALEAACQPSTTTGPTGTTTSPTTTVKIVSDNSGTLTDKNYRQSASNDIAAFPGPNGGNFSSCDYLAGVLNDPKEGASSFKSALNFARIESIITTAQSGICAKLKISNDREQQNCVNNFRKYLKACIADYYAGNSHATPISLSEPFDTTVVSICVENAAKKDGYRISAEDIAGILEVSQDANTPANSPGASTDDACSLLPPDTQMRWLACSLLLAGRGIADAFFAAIQSLLYTPTNALFDDAGAFKKMASTFRIIGMALLIIMGLIMIIAQASGSDIVDAYTVKKVLPKIGIALVGMALAWPLLRLAVGATNDISIGLGSFVKDLAGSSPSSAATNSGDVVSLIVTGFVGGGAGTAILVVSLGAWGILSLLGTVILALLIGLAVLAFRQLVIVMLILLAPLAIAASVMPGTDKLWKFWRATLLSTLMMFPIIMLFLSSGTLMASIFGKMEGDKNINSLMAVLVYFAPYFLLPFAFKLSGGLLANIFQIANDKGKGAFDRLRNGRAEIKKGRVKRASQGHLWDPSSRIQKAIGGNTIASWVGDTKGMGAYTLRKVPGFRRPGELAASQVAAAKAEHTEKMANVMTAANFNDRAGRALSGVHEGLSEHARTELKKKGLYGKRVKTVKDLETVAGILASSQGEDSGSIAERSAGQQILAARGSIAGAYMSEDMGRADIGSAAFMVMAAQGYANPDDINTFGNKLNEEIGIQDATAITGRAINLGAGKRLDVAPGYSNVQDANGNWHRGDAGTEEEKNRMADNVLKNGYTEWSQAKPESIKDSAESFYYNLNNGDAVRAEKQILQLQQAVSGGLGNAATAIEADKLIRNGFERVTGYDEEKQQNITERVQFSQEVQDRILGARVPGGTPDAERAAQHNASTTFTPPPVPPGGGFPPVKLG